MTPRGQRNPEAIINDRDTGHPVHEVKMTALPAAAGARRQPRAPDHPGVYCSSSQVCYRAQVSVARRIASMLTTARQARTNSWIRSRNFVKTGCSRRLNMSISTEKAIKDLLSAMSRFGQAAQHVHTAGVMSLGADQMVFRLTQTLEDLSLGCLDMSMGIKNLAEAIQKLEK
jgi:hypothetical protein